MKKEILLIHIARRHGHVFRMALHNEGDWRKETWQWARQGELSCLHTPIPELCNAILNTCQMPSRLYIIPSNVNEIQTHLLKPFTARDLMEGHICRQNTLMFALVFCLNCVHVPPARAVTAISLWKSDSWRQARSVKTAKKSWTVPQCGHVTLNCVQMVPKQENVEFSSYIFQFTHLHGVAVMQGLSFRDSVVTLFKSARCYVLSGTGFLVAHQLYIGNVMRECKIGKLSPHQPCENTCHSNILEWSLLSMARALACYESWPKISWSSDWWLKKVRISAIFFPDILKF